MKKGLYALLAVLMVLAMATVGCKTDDDTGGTSGGGTDTAVTLSSVTANGSASSTTTSLNLTFSAAITGLSAGDIAVTGVSGFTGFTKGTTLTAGTTAGTYTLPITVTAAGSVSVAVTKSGYAITGSPKTVALNFFAGNPGDIQVTLNSVAANGAANTTTSTQLTLTFSAAITGLSADDITVTATGVTKGTTLTAGTTAGTYTLPITVTAAATASVSVTKSGYNISGSPVTGVAVHFAAGVTPPTPDAFDQAVAIKEVAVAASGTVSADTETGIISLPTTETGYSNYFSVKIPASELPILAADTIVIKYIGRGGNAPITPKRKGAQGDGASPDDISAPWYYTATSNLTEQTWSIPATRYTDLIPTEVLWFQARPNNTGDNGPWELKFTSITVTKGALIKIDAAVDGLKPVTGATPLLSVDTLQYTGAITWKDASGNNVSGDFAGGVAYTATVVLTKKAGYTFEGIAANSFTVTGSKTVSHNAGAAADNTLTITATFEATKAPATDHILTFTDVDDIFKKNVTVTLLTGDIGFKAVTLAGYEYAWAYFKVTFPAGYTLSDYSKISYTIEGVDGGTGSDASGYKAGFMMVYATEAEIEDLEKLNDNTHLVFTETPGGSATGVGNLNQAATRTVTVKVPAGTDLNEVYIAYRVGGSAGWTWELSNIKFFNPPVAP